MLTLSDTLHTLTVGNLTPLKAHLPGALKAGQKHLLVDSMVHEMFSPRWQAVWEKLNAVQRLAVGEAVHDERGIFHADRFVAKYGARPAFFETVMDAPRRPREGSPTALCLFLHVIDRQRVIPTDLRQALKGHIPVPAPDTLKSSEALPQADEQAPLTVRLTEQDALLDVVVMLRSIDQGQIVVSDKTAMPGSAALRLLGDKLSGGDFYESVPKANKWDQQVGPIKAVAWPLLIQAAKLAQINGSKLGLTKAGIKTSLAAPVDVLRDLWQKWQSSTLIDEFSRIDDIKGQKAKGPVMSALAPRRAAVSAALRCCPVGQWVSIDELSRYMQAQDFGLKVCLDPWKLYLGDPKYGALGYEPMPSWNIFQLRYLLCLLFEYCATLGMIDVAYGPAEDARPDFRCQWGADDLTFLSRYDGLMYLRLTAVGAYCLGVDATYASRGGPRPGEVALAVQASLHVRVTQGALAADEALWLETWANLETDGLWCLSREKAIMAIERGHDIAQLEAFLCARDTQPLPMQVEHFLRISDKQGRALKVVATTLLIECVDASTADTVAGHPETARLCMRVGERHLVVRLEHESKFRHAIRVAGFGVSV